jgi:hypothetical protein
MFPDRSVTYVPGLYRVTSNTIKKCAVKGASCIPRGEQRPPRVPLSCVLRAASGGSGACLTYRLTVTRGGGHTPLWARPLGAVEAERSPRTAVVPDTSLAQRRASQSSACARSRGRS